MTAAARPAPKAKLAGSDRRKQLVLIAMDQIATKGFEGLRFQEVAQEAGINNATLYYHFPTKEALIRGVVTHLMGELKVQRAGSQPAAANAREELRLEFEGVRQLLRANQKLFIVLTELSLRALRDPAVKKIGDNRDDFWRGHLSEIIERGIAQQRFRSDINVHAAVTNIMVQIKGLGYHATMATRKAGEVDKAITGIAEQVDHWLTCRTK